MLKILKDRLISFGIIFCLGLLFFISLVFDALIVVLKDYLNSVLPSYTYVILKTAKFLFSFSAATITFAFLFKFLPDVRIKWRVTWMGAIITAILFSIGKGLITFGLGEFGIASMYGATGTVVIFLLWVFYSALIFYFGAEITEQYALQTSKNIVPKNYAVSFKITEYKEEETEPSANHKEVLETIDKTDMNLS